MARLYSYIVRYDTGFAPNPFHGYCTLASCKHRIRGAADVGDWIIGTGSKSRQRDGYLVYAMRVTETMSFDEYWKDPRFQNKKPVKNSDGERACGDNIYYRDPTTNQLCQMTGYFHHACDMTRDTKADRVLISDDFIYWGKDGPPLPEYSGVSLLVKTQGYKCRFPEAAVEQFGDWFGGLDRKGVRGNPMDWQRKA